jgi:CheY-like chemotaxis protein
MPYGKVLIVDDVETNLYVAEGLMLPYKIGIETVNSGYLAIEKVESGKIYDIIFMDHMMPLLDGIETTKRLRAMGYKGVIVALTANALIGNEEMFKLNGFDDFISKPIDVRQLNDRLNKYIRDRHPNEAGKHKPEKVSSKLVTQTQPATGNPKLLEVFRRDAEKAAVVLQNTMVNGDIKLFTTTAHAIKSALANIGKNEMSELAFSLEKAGLDSDTDFISANTGHFIETLESLTSSLRPTRPTASEVEMSIIDDMAYLIEQLQVIESACENYDRKTAFAAFDLLKEKQWKTETAEMLENIQDMLLLHSDFDGAGERINMFFKDNGGTL